jgi:GT2 family glycosyltransferase
MAVIESQEMLGRAVQESGGGVSAIIVTYFTGPLLKPCLATAEADPSIDETILVDNGNPPEVAAALKDWAAERPGRKLLQGHGNVGFGRGCNLGAAAARGAYVLFLNPDAVLHADAAGALVEALEGAPSPALVGGHLLDSDGAPQKGARRERLTLWRALVAGAGLSRFERLSPALRDMHRHKDPLPDHVAPISVVSGAFMAMRRADFLAVGGFDEGYFLHVEDIDLCARVEKAGGIVLFQPRAVATHAGSASDAPSSFVALHKIRGFRRYFRNHGASRVEQLAAAAGGAVLEAVLRLRSRGVPNKE